MIVGEAKRVSLSPDKDKNGIEAKLRSWTDIDELFLILLSSLLRRRLCPSPRYPCCKLYMSKSS